MVWNRNQGNVRAARAEVQAAVFDVTRVQNDLADRVATAFRTYASARRRAGKYCTAILPKAEENYEFVKKQMDKGVVEYLKVLQAQRAVADARQEYNRVVGEAWRAAGELSGLLMEEGWPVVPSGR